MVLLRANALASILQSFGQRELHNSTDGSEFLLEVSEGGNSSTALMESNWELDRLECEKKHFRSGVSPLSDISQAP